jgi:hypothetical protein
MMTGACTSDCPEKTDLRPLAVTCHFDVDRTKVRDPRNKFEVRGTAQKPQYIVRFDGYLGNASLEKHDRLWPETFDLKISDDRDTILFVTLTPKGFGEICLLFLPGKKWVNYSSC